MKIGTLELTDVLGAAGEDHGTKAIVLTPTIRARRGRLRPSHQGQEKAEDEKVTHRQMLLRNEAFGIHHAGGFGFVSAEKNDAQTFTLLLNVNDQRQGPTHLQSKTRTPKAVVGH